MEPAGSESCGLAKGVAISEVKSLKIGETTREIVIFRLQGLVIVHICSGWEKVILDVFFMQRLVKGWCFSMKRLVPTSSPFDYLNVFFIFSFSNAL